MITARPSCFSPLWQEARRDFSVAVTSAGRSKAARMAMIAMTTSSSIKVNEW